MKDKIALFCNVPSEHVLQNLDVEYLYEAPLAMERENLAQAVLNCLHLEQREPDLSDWIEMTEALKNPKQEAEIAIVGKYTQLHDAYLSVVEALKHGGISCHTDIRFRWTDSETITEENVEETFVAWMEFSCREGLGDGATEGMILAAEYARRRKSHILESAWECRWLSWPSPGLSWDITMRAVSSFSRRPCIRLSL